MWQRNCLRLCVILETLSRCRCESAAEDAHEAGALAEVRGRPGLEHLGSEDALFACVWERILQGSGTDAIRVFIDVGTHEKTDFWRHVAEDDGVWVIGFEPNIESFKKHVKFFGYDRVIFQPRLLPALKSSASFTTHRISQTGFAIP